MLKFSKNLNELILNVERLLQMLKVMKEKIWMIIIGRENFFTESF